MRSHDEGTAKILATEIKEIITTLVVIRPGELKVQNRLRHRLRNEFKFYISDFD